MATAVTYTKTGNKATTAVKLSAKVFGVASPSEELIKQAYLAYQAGGRQNIARAKDRSEVRGGGAKPWRQKGTGRARHGTRSSPIWKGGGITFAPTGKENYSKKLSTKAKRSALRQALSALTAAKRVKIIEQFEIKDMKTKSAMALLSKLEATGGALLVSEQPSPELARATANIPDIKVLPALRLNVFDLLNADQVIIEKPALSVINQWLDGEKK